MARLDERAPLRDLLYVAITEEHRLHEAATAEETAAGRWETRGALAERKEDPDLADDARQRAAQYRRRAQVYRAEALRQQAHIAELKAAQVRAAAPSRPLIVPLGDYDPVARQMAALEHDDRLERDLAELKHQLGTK